MKLFASEQFHDFVDKRRAAIREEIEKFNDDRLLTAIDTELGQALSEKYDLKPIILHFEDMSVDGGEKTVDIPLPRNPDPFAITYHRFPVSRGTEKKHVIVLTIPFSGDGSLLKYRPNPFIQFDPEVNITTSKESNEDTITVDLINHGETKEYAQQQINEFKQSLEKQIQHLNQQITGFSKTLMQIIMTNLGNRKKLVLKRKNLIESLGIPLTKNKNVPETLTVPVEKKKIDVIPNKQTTEFKAEPTISKDIYQSILTLIHDWGVVMERHPDTYEGKGEEALRNLFILLLTPHFKMQSVTGETFNSTGKTDILIRYENTNLFVAECKFWTGEKGLPETISQLLGYLTWRDSKTCIIVFVNRKNISSIDDDIKNFVAQHPCYSSFVDKQAEGFYNFIFRMSEQDAKKVYLAVLLFHFKSED